jgi:hypothetical protein
MLRERKLCILQVLLPKTTGGLEPISYRALLNTLLLLHVTVYVTHNLLNVLAQIANKMELKKTLCSKSRTSYQSFASACHIWSVSKERVVSVIK